MPIMAIPEREERTEEIFVVLTAENFPKLLTNTKPQIQETHRIPSRINTKINSKWIPSRMNTKINSKGLNVGLTL